MYIFGTRTRSFLFTSATESRVCAIWVPIWKRVRRWQSEIARGALLGPHIVSCGAVLSTDPSGDPKLPVEIVNTPQEARKAFDRDYERRVDFIKVLDLSEPAFEALAEASRHDGVPFAGDLPSGVSAFAAARDRMSSMEHLFGLGLACSRKENELRSRSLSCSREKRSGCHRRHRHGSNVDLRYRSSGNSLGFVPPLRCAANADAY